MAVTFLDNVTPTTDQVVDLYDNCGLPRPTHDKERITAMFHNSNLVITAWDGHLLIGLSRTITDWVWSSYLADLAVRKEYSKAGIGKALIEQTRHKLGDRCSVLLLSVASAMDYYPRVGFTAVDNGFIITRKE